MYSFISQFSRWSSCNFRDFKKRENLPHSYPSRVLSRCWKGFYFTFVIFAVWGHWTTMQAASGAATWPDVPWLLNNHKLYSLEWITLMRWLLKPSQDPPRCLTDGNKSTEWISCHITARLVRNWSYFYVLNTKFGNAVYKWQFNLGGL